jgi:hypothetical protein
LPHFVLDNEKKKTVQTIITEDNPKRIAKATTLPTQKNLYSDKITMASESYFERLRKTPQ